MMIMLKLLLTKLIMKGHSPETKYTDNVNTVKETKDIIKLLNFS